MADSKLILVTGATGYTIQASLSNTFGSLAINTTIKTPTSAYTATFNLVAGKLYYWRVRAHNASGYSSFSSRSFSTSTAIPAKPRLLTPAADNVPAGPAGVLVIRCRLVAEGPATS